MNAMIYDDFQGKGDWISLDELENFNKHDVSTFDRKGFFKKYTISEFTLEKIVKPIFVGMRRSNSGESVIEKHLIPVAEISSSWVHPSFKDFMYTLSLLHDAGEDKHKSKIKFVANNDDHNPIMDSYTPFNIPKETLLLTQILQGFNKKEMQSFIKSNNNYSNTYSQFFPNDSSSKKSLDSFLNEDFSFEKIKNFTVLNKEQYVSLFHILHHFSEETEEELAKKQLSAFNYTHYIMCISGKYGIPFLNIIESDLASTFRIGGKIADLYNNTDNIESDFKPNYHRRVFNEIMKLPRNKRKDVFLREVGLDRESVTKRTYLAKKKWKALDLIERNTIRFLIYVPYLLSELSQKKNYFNIYNSPKLLTDTNLIQHQFRGYLQHREII